MNIRQYPKANRPWRLAALCLLAVAWLSFAARADVALLDEWGSAERITLSTEGTRLLFQKGEAGVMLTAEGQALRILPNGGGQGLTACHARGPEEGGSATISAQFGNIAADFHLSPAGTVRITPLSGLEDLRIEAACAVGILPGIRLEDVLYRPEEFSEADTLYVPADNWFAGMMSGEGGIVAMAWPEGGQRLTLALEGEGEERHIAAFGLTLDGKDLYLEILAAPGIWHCEPLELGYLEKDVPIGWKRPVPAQYKTQFPLKAETETLRTFFLVEGRREHWRPETGQFVLPAWLDGDQTCLSLSKRVPTKGDAVFYPWSDHETSLLGFLGRTPVGETIHKRAKTAPSSPGLLNAPNVGYNACWGTFLLRRTVYTRGAQTRDQAYFAEHIDFVVDRVAEVQQNNARYADFIERMRSTLQTWLRDTNDDAVREYLEGMLSHDEKVKEGHHAKMDRFGFNTPEGHIAHAQQNGARIKELLKTPGGEIYPECEKLIDELNRLSWGHNEATGMRFGMLTRDWARETLVSCATIPQATEYAAQIRAAIRQALNGAPEW